MIVVVVIKEVSAAIDLGVMEAVVDTKEATATAAMGDS